MQQSTVEPQKDTSHTMALAKDKAKLAVAAVKGEQTQVGEKCLRRCCRAAASLCYACVFAKVMKSKVKSRICVINHNHATGQLVTSVPHLSCWVATFLFLIRSGPICGRHQSYPAR